MFIEGTNDSLTLISLPIVARGSIVCSPKYIELMVVARGSIVCSSKYIELMVVITSSITEYFSVFT